MEGSVCMPTPNPPPHKVHIDFCFLTYRFQGIQIFIAASELVPMYTKSLKASQFLASLRYDVKLLLFGLDNPVFSFGLFCLMTFCYEFWSSS